MDKEIKNILNEIIDTETVSIKKENAYNSIDTIEQIYGVNLPLKYKDFLIEFGGCFIKDDKMYQPIEITPVTSEDCFESIGGFYGLTNDNYNIENVIRNSMEFLGKDVMPIADADGGDLICLGLRGNFKGKVYYWYHEGETIGHGGKEYFYLIANSFKDFIFKFTHHEREINVNLDDIEIFLDEDLLED